jgi:pimeloyl-ACP methyl ester carboxylesterase
VTCRYQPIFINISDSGAEHGQYDADIARSGAGVVAADLCAGDACAVAIRAGNGRQPHPRRQYRRDRRRILAEAPPRFALAGHSMGGYIAFEILRQAPQRVAKLALINTQARPDTPEAREKRRVLIARVQAGHYHDVLDGLFPGFVHPSRQGDADLRKLVHDMGDDVGADGFVRQQTAIMSRADSRPTLATIACPTVVLTGDADNTIPNTLSVEMADGIPGASLVIIPVCGHLPQPEQPQAAAAALEAWLAS